MSNHPNELTFVDAAYESAITGGPYDGVVFYLPGGDAFHPWSHGDLAARHERYRLPAWVRSNPQSASPTADAGACLAQLHAYGVPRGALVALDSETSIDPNWVATFAHDLNAAMYPVIDYGSQSTVFGNDNPDGYVWGADWTDVRHLASGDDMTQYANFRGYDQSVASSALPFWDTKPPAPTQQWGDADVILPVLSHGSADVPGGGFWYVHRAQSLAMLSGGLLGIPAAAGLTVDGQYGQLTGTGIRAIQQHYGINIDGVCGPQTWSVLLTGTA
jgi:peptidoglycan hydrolase-like protein with peptidoglycan-binding domain